MQKEVICLQPIIFPTPDMTNPSAFFEPNGQIKQEDELGVAVKNIYEQFQQTSCRQEASNPSTFQDRLVSNLSSSFTVVSVADDDFPVSTEGEELSGSCFLRESFIKGAAAPETPPIIEKDISGEIKDEAGSQSSTTNCSSDKVIENLLNQFDADLKVLEELFNGLKDAEGFYKNIKAVSKNTKPAKKFIKIVNDYLKILPPEKAEILGNLLKLLSTGSLVLPAPLYFSFTLIGEIYQHILTLKTKYHLNGECHDPHSATYKMQKEIVILGQRLEEERHALVQRVNKSYFTTTKKTLSLIDQIFSIFSTVSDKVDTSSLKGIVNCVKEGASIHDQNKGLAIQQQKINDLKPLTVAPQLQEKFNLFLKELELCNSIEESREALAAVKEIFEKHNLKWILVSSRPWLTWKKQFSTTSYRDTLFKQYKEANFKDLIEDTYTPENIKSLLEKRKVIYKKQLDNAKIEIEGLIDQVRQGLISFEVFKAKLLEKGIKFSTQELWDKAAHLLESDRGDLLPPLSDINDLEKFISQEEGLEKLARYFVRTKEAREAMLKKTLKDWMAKKCSMEKEFLKFARSISVLTLASKVVQTALSLAPALSCLTFSRLFLLPLLAEFNFAGACLIPWVLPTLIPTLLGTLLFSAGLYFAYKRKPCQNDLKGLTLRLEEQILTNLQTIQKLAIALKGLATYCLAQAVNKLRFIGIPSTEWDLNDKTEEKDSKSSQDFLSKRLQTLQNQFRALAWKDFLLHLKYSETTINSIDEEINPLLILQQALNYSDFSTDMLNFLKMELSIDSEDLAKTPADSLHKVEQQILLNLGPAANKIVSFFTNNAEDLNEHLRIQYAYKKNFESSQEGSFTT